MQKVNCSQALGLQSGFGLKSCETEAAEGERLETGLREGVFLKAGVKSSPGAQGLKCLKKQHIYSIWYISQQLESPNGLGIRGQILMS